MKHLVILSVVMGCFATAQLNAERAIYRPVKPFRYDSFPSAARVPANVAKAAISPTLLGDHQIRLMLDAHIVCLSELKGAKDRLDDTNFVIEQLKLEITEDISRINEQLAQIFRNFNLEDVKDQLNVNTQFVAETVMNLHILDEKLTVTNRNTSDTLTRYQNEMSNAFETLREDQRETAENLTAAQYEIASLTTDLGVVRQQSNDTYHYVEELKAGWTATDFAVADLMSDLNVTREEALASNVRIAELASILNASTSPSSTGEMPGSCADLRRIGHVKSGIHLVVGQKGVESVYCDFTLEEMDHWIGYADVKTEPVYFSVQRTSRFNTTNVPIPFNVAKSTIGKAMNLTSGVFTAPKTGTYFFIFNGLAEFDETSNIIPYLAVGLFLNKSGNRIALALTEEAHTVKDQYRGQRVPLALQTTIRLHEGDQVWLEIFAQSGMVSLFDNTNNHSAFTGWLMEEEISL